MQKEASIGEELEIEIQDFFELSKNGGIYEIETPQGWIEIGDLVLKNNKECYIIRTESGLDLGGSEDHYVETNNGWEPLKKIDVQNSFVITKNGNDKIIAKEYIGIEDTFDLEVLNEEHKYYANGIVSHNTGKTMLCKLFVNEVPATVIYILPSHISRLGDISRICKMAKELSPTLLIIEDIDFIAQDRDSDNNWSVIELMNQLDGVEDFEDVITLATTNKVEKIETAIKNRPGRFDRVINIPLPSSEIRMKMLKRFCSNFKFNNTVDFDKLVKNTDKMTGAYLKNLVTTAALMSVQNGNVDKKNNVIINMKDFEDALGEIKNKDFTRFYESINNKSPMGFRFEEV